MWRFILIGIGLLGLVIFGFSLADVASEGDLAAEAMIEVPAADITSFTQAIDAYDWQFPRDFGSHEDFLTEWWYYTGNVATETGERFGYQFTIFRRAMQPESAVSNSEWRSSQVYMAHFTVSDISRERFMHSERYSRGGAGLAGATTDPVYRVWLEDWQIQATDADGMQVRIQADDGDFSIDLMLDSLKEPVLQGEGGLSPKSADIGNASYYYSLTRQQTEGEIRIGDDRFSVSGYSWKDHEFSTSALSGNAVGWDWFGLIMDEGYELMIGDIRLQDGGTEPAFSGKLVYPDGQSETLASDQFTITATSTWTSPHTGAVYPSGWDVTLNSEAGDFSFQITPLMADQELVGGSTQYWEGAVRVSGDFNGYGYAELTGYVEALQLRF